jgi:hypothetical protein
MSKSSKVTTLTKVGRKRPSKTEEKKLQKQLRKW